MDASSPDRPSGRTTTRRARRMTSLLAAALIAGSAVVAGSATAAVPVFPDNIIVFPDRDFISSEGFQDHVGETALVEVRRPGVAGVIGSARVTIAAGGLPFEVNHPGGACWGAGTGLNVTPDIGPNDVVSVSFAGSSVDTTTGDAYVTSIDYADGATTFTVTGHIGPNVDPANLEQRIVNPALTDTAVGRREVNAVPGPLVANRSGAYQSGLTVNGSTVTATYVFNDAALARTAATGGGARLMSWQVTDAAANRQGLTISEFGEPGGPGMGGCPNGPLTSGPAGPTGVTANLLAGGASVKVDWTPAVAVPGTPAITGYRVTAVGRTVTGGQQSTLGRRIAGVSATTTTITGLTPGETYDVEVESVSSAGTTMPPVVITPGTDIIPPTVAASPAGGAYAAATTVTLSASEPNSQIFYTLDGSDPLDAPGSLSPTALRYTGPLTISATTTLRSVAFDAAGNDSGTRTDAYLIDAGAVLPGAPHIDSATPGVGSITVTWSRNPADVVTEFTVAVTNADGSLRTDLAQNPISVAAPENTVTVNGLTEGTAYYFTVTAHNANGAGPASSRVGPVSPLGTVVANAGPDQTVTRSLSVASRTVTLTGAGSSTDPGTVYLWEQLSGDVVSIASPSALSTSFVLPLFRTPMTNAPMTFRLTVTNGAGTRSDTVVVTPRAGDTVAVTRATWKVGDFRIDGSGTVDGSTVTVHTGSAGGPVIGTATVTAGVWTLRLRNAAAGATRPASLWIESTLGSTAGPIAVG